MPAKDPTDRVVGEILLGRHDGRFKEIAQAIQKRQDEGHTRFIWRITLPDGQTWDGLSVTAGELAFAETATRIPWKKLNPADSIGEFVALVTAHHHKVGGHDLDKALALTEALTAEEAEAAVDDYELVSPPKASTESTTT